MNDKTICEQEFEKWWRNEIEKSSKEWSQYVWDIAWRTCGQLIEKEIKEKFPSI